ncbi:MAG: FAD-binding protein [Spirochaetaceae bacterium]
MNVPESYYNTIILGSGAASLAAAIRLKRAGQDDLCIITDDINGGTSRNTGSDKQTYYKLSDSSGTPDSPYKMAEALFQGGAVHGDIALVESLTSENGFYHLVGLGVPFPYNNKGGYTGYKTDHDPNNRGTSLGPYTSKVMVEYLEKECRLLNIPILDRHDCVRLIKAGNRIAGAVVLDKKSINSSNYGLKTILCENMIFGLGGPGGMYQTSVYPTAHTGGIGLALEIGAEVVNLTESQYGIGSVKFRWNLSGSYQQVIPNYFSRDPKTGETFQFLEDYFDSIKDLSRSIFLKGYQWPFDPDKIKNSGSSLVDLLIYRESEVLNREVFMDFRDNLKGNEDIGYFLPSNLDSETLEYWKKSGLSANTPIKRLEELNPEAITLYLDHNIDLYNEPLQIAVCSQHNNGGLAGDIWWESTNIPHFFPIGEVNGSHGIYRPGGTALNSGQVGAFRASQKIASVYREPTLNRSEARVSAKKAFNTVYTLINKLCSEPEESDCIAIFRAEYQNRMSRDGAFIRDPQSIKQSCHDAFLQINRFSKLRVNINRISHVLKMRHLSLAHWFYLEAIRNYIDKDGGSRGSYLIKSKDGDSLHHELTDEWKALKANPKLKNQMQYISWNNNKPDVLDFKWEQCRGIPKDEYWFETVWAEYLDKSVFNL